MGTDRDGSRGLRVRRRTVFGAVAGGFLAPRLAGLTGGAAEAAPVPPDPIAQPITFGSLGVTLLDHCTPPATAGSRPLALLNYLHHAGDGSGRLFAADSRGKLWAIAANGAPSLFLDLAKILKGRLVLDRTTVRLGLRTFAFHPDFARPGRPGHRRLYTIHTDTPGSAPAGVPLLGDPALPVNHHDVITEWRTSATNPGKVTPSSAREVLRIRQWGAGHNTDQLLFDPNLEPGQNGYGLMFVSVGDGKNNPPHTDPYDQAQNPLSPLGKILRINPLQRNARRYTVPKSNPFVGQDGWLPEIWALGLRHPEFLCFDTGGTGRMIIAEIGQAKIEQVRVDAKGANHGWPQREGTFVTDRFNEDVLEPLPANDAVFGYTYPVAQYDHSEGEAICGGYVYRGTAIPALAGHYLFGDIKNGRVFAVPEASLIPGAQAAIQEVRLYRNGSPVTLRGLLGTTGRVDLRFGQDEAGELYLMTKQDGVIRKLGPA